MSVHIGSSLEKLLSGIEADVLLDGSNFTIRWLLDTLLKKCPEFQESLGSGVVTEVFGFIFATDYSAVKVLATS